MFAETDAGLTPSPSNVFDFTSRKFPNTNANSVPHRLYWEPSDFASLEFQPTNTTATNPIFNLYGYTDLTNFGTPSSTVDSWLLS